MCWRGRATLAARLSCGRRYVGGSLLWQCGIPVRLQNVLLQGGLGQQTSCHAIDCSPCLTLPLALASTACGFNHTSTCCHCMQVHYSAANVPFCMYYVSVAGRVKTFYLLKQ